MKFETNIALSTPDKISIYGYDLVDELLGQVSITDMIFLGILNRKPSENESRMLNAVMVSVSEHGFTPSSLSARLTYLGAPESIQAAIASGLLGAGSVYLGSMEKTAKILQVGYEKYKTQSVEKIADHIFNEEKSKGEFLPGFGHPIHKPTDPRTVKLFSLADELKISGVYVGIMKKIHETLNVEKGSTLTLNASGAIGAVLSDMGIRWEMVKPILIVARAAGLIGHLMEELNHGRKNSVAQQLYDFAENNTEYRI